MSRSQKEREVLQLLKDYQTYYAAFGGAMSLEDQGVAEAAYGPAGMITSGAEFGMADELRVDLHQLAESYRLLEHALTYLKGDGEEGMTAYVLLLGLYLGDPGDPSIVDEWRKKRPGLADWHDYAIRKLAEYLKHKDLYTVPTKLLSEGEERRMEDTNREMVAVYRRLKNSGLSERGAKEQTGEFFGVSVGTVERVVEFRHDFEREICKAEDCTREPERQGLCWKHYQREVRQRRAG